MNKPPTKLALQLAERIKREFDIIVKPKIYRTRAGWSQRALGAFSWYMISDVEDIGSCYQALEVVKAKKLELIGYGEIEIVERVKIQKGK